MTDSSVSWAQEVIEAQEQFWAALKTKDAWAFERVLADHFVSRSPGAANQGRGEFIQTLIAFPATVLAVHCEDLEVHHFSDVAVLTGVQVADIHLPDGKSGENRIAITNIFQQIFGQWKMVLAHAVELHPLTGQSSATTP